MKYKVLISHIGFASMLAPTFAIPMFRPTATPNHGASWVRPALPVASPGLLVAQGGMLRERLLERERAKTKEVEEELEKNPKLVDDPNYLEQHPKLARYLRNHPDAKRKIEQDPKAFFANMENEGKRLHD
jgi:hypothetical protein